MSKRWPEELPVFRIRSGYCHEGETVEGMGDDGDTLDPWIVVRFTDADGGAGDSWDEYSPEALMALTVGAREMQQVVREMRLEAVLRNR